ncbi:MAG: YlxR family protein [Clostridia bacterium]|nr:YlxR family protein [Clostridia bacterium]
MAQAVKQKKIPTRRCVGCGEHLPKSSLIRVLRTPEGEIVLDLVGKRSGRGAYLCKSVACFKKAVKSKRLESSLECKIPDEVYIKLEEELAVGKES